MVRTPDPEGRAHRDRNRPRHPGAARHRRGPAQDRRANSDVRDGQVIAAIELLDGGATVPFIARYRKEATGALDDAQLRTLERAARATCASSRSAGPRSWSRSAPRASSTTRCAAQIMAAETKARLEDIYLPYKPKRRTKAQIAREAGLEPLADQLLADPHADPAQPPPATSTPSGASPTRPPRSTAPRRSWSSGSPRTPT